MKFLLSLNRLMQHPEPKLFHKLLQNFLNYEKLDGFEINCNVMDPKERQFLKAFTMLQRDAGKIVQIHSFKGFQEYYNDYYMTEMVLGFYHEISEIMGSKVKVVIHPCESECTCTAQNNTRKFIHQLNRIRSRHDYKLEFCLENLNRTRERLNTEDIGPIIDETEVGFCWDVGHEVFESTCKYELQRTLMDRLENVHIHDVHDTDHYPFEYGNVDYPRAINYLDYIGYKGSVVLEINMNLIPLDGIQEKYEIYMQNLSLLTDHYGEGTQRKVESAGGWFDVDFYAF